MNGQTADDGPAPGTAPRPPVDPGQLPVRRPGVALREATRRAPPGAVPPVGAGVRIARPEADLVQRLLDGLRRL